MNSPGAFQMFLPDASSKQKTPTYIAEPGEPTDILLKKFRGEKLIVRSFCITSRDPPGYPTGNGGVF